MKQDTDRMWDYLIFPKLFFYHLWRRKNGFLIESHEDIVLLVGPPDCWSRGILSDDLNEMLSIKPIYLHKFLSQFCTRSCAFIV